MVKAFPNVTGQQGMTLRDYFAAKALNGMIANGISNYTLAGKKIDGDMMLAAEAAYVLADAMMKVRDEKAP